MLKEFGNEGFGKFILVEDNEGIAFFRPTDEIRIARFIEKAKSRVRIPRAGGG